MKNPSSSRLETVSFLATKNPFTVYLTVFLALLFNVSIYGQNAPRTITRTLPSGKDINVEMTGTEIDRYEVDLQAGEFFQVRVEQKGIDVVLLLLDVNGRQLAQMDSPNGNTGLEIFTFVPDSTGSFALIVKSSEKDAVKGRYTIWRAASRTATADDRKLVEVEQAYYEAIHAIVPLIKEGILTIKASDKKLIETIIAKLKTASRGWLELKDVKMSTSAAELIPLLEQLYKQTFKEGPELVVQTSHGGWIQSIAFSHNKKILATGGGDGTIKLWDVDTGRQIRTLAGHARVKVDRPSKNPYPVDSKDSVVNAFNSMANDGQVNTPFSLAFSPDDKFLASGSDARTIIIWDITVGKPAMVFPSPTSVWFIAFSQDGHTLLSRSEYKNEENIYKFWDVSTGSELKDNAPPLSSFRLPWQSPDRKLIVSHSENETEIKITNAINKQVKILRGHEAGVRQAVFSPNGNILASGGWDRTVRLWDVTGKEKTKILGRHDSVVTALSFSFDGKILASGGEDLIVKLWDVATGKELRTIRRYTNSARPFAFAKNDSILITSSDDLLHVWDLKKGYKYGAVRVHPGLVSNVVLSWDKNLMATHDRSVFSLIRFARASEVFDERSKSELGAETYKKITEQLISQPVKVPSDFPSWVKRLSSDKVIRLWDAENISLKQEFTGHNDYISSLAFSPGQTLLASGDDSGTIKLWKLGTQEEPITLKVDESNIESLAFSRDGKLLASGDKEGTIRFWDITSKIKLPLTLGKQSAAVKWIVFSSDNKTLISCYLSKDNEIVNVWDIDTRQLKESFSFGENQQKRDELLKLVPDLSQRANYPISDDYKFAAKTGPQGRVGLYAREGDELLAWLIALGDQDWAVVTPDGRFDTNRLEEPEGLNWVFSDEPLTPLPFEIFMRDYFEPRLLPRLMKGEKFAEIPLLAELNRNQPKVGKITILPQTDHPDLVDVKVEVSSAAGHCFRSDKFIPCESGVYDLRLYRDGQIVGQFPNQNIDVSTDGSNKQTRQEFVQQWRKENVVRGSNNNSVSVATGGQEVIFKNIRSPKRIDVSQVTFTAYAFNEDRVKSETSKPVVYALPKTRPTNILRRAYIVTVGVDATSDRNLRLLFAPNGARDIEQFLRDRLQSKYEVVPVQLISELQDGGIGFKQNLATKSNIQTVLSILSGRKVEATERQQIPNQDKLQAATPDDLVILYIASHGYSDLKRMFYIMPSDLEVSTGETEPLLRCLISTEQSSKCKADQLKASQSLLHHSISSEELAQWLQTIDAGEMTLILDSCHSEAASGPNFKPGPMGDRGFGQLSYDKGMLVLAATQADNLATGGIPLNDRSILTIALKIALPAKDDNPQSSDIKLWLGVADKLVPMLYERYFAQEEQPRQESVFFDFTKKY
jgi:WD40 repeat protein